MVKVPVTARALQQRPPGRLVRGRHEGQRRARARRGRCRAGAPTGRSARVGGDAMSSEDLDKLYLKLLSDMEEHFIEQTLGKDQRTIDAVAEMISALRMMIET